MNKTHTAVTWAQHKARHSTGYEQQTALSERGSPKPLSKLLRERQQCIAQGADGALAIVPWWEEWYWMSFLLDLLPAAWTHTGERPGGPELFFFEVRDLGDVFIEVVVVRFVGVMSIVAEGTSVPGHRLHSGIGGDGVVVVGSILAPIRLPRTPSVATYACVIIHRLFGRRNVGPALPGRRLLPAPGVMITLTKPLFHSMLC